VLRFTPFIFNVFSFFVFYTCFCFIFVFFAFLIFFYRFCFGFIFAGSFCRCRCCRRRFRFRRIFFRLARSPGGYKYFAQFLNSLVELVLANSNSVIIFLVLNILPFRGPLKFLFVKNISLAWLWGYSRFFKRANLFLKLFRKQIKPF